MSVRISSLFFFVALFDHGLISPSISQCCVRQPGTRSVASHENDDFPGPRVPWLPSWTCLFVCDVAKTIVMKAALGWEKGGSYCMYCVVVGVVLAHNEQTNTEASIRKNFQCTEENEW